MTKKTALKEIKEIDDSIDLMRTHLEKCDGKQKSRFMKIVDRLLDERLELMTERDKKKKKTVVPV